MHGKNFDFIAKIINAGFIPHADTIGIVRGRRGINFIAHDLDFFAHINWLQARKESYGAVELTNYLNRIINQMTLAGMTHKEIIEELKTRVTTGKGLTAINILSLKNSSSSVA